MLMQRQAVGEGAGWPQVTKHKAPLPRDLLAGLAHQPGAGRRQIEGRLPASTEGSISQKSCPTIGSEDPARGRALGTAPQTFPTPGGRSQDHQDGDGDSASCHLLEFTAAKIPQGLGPESH